MPSSLGAPRSSAAGKSIASRAPKTAGGTSRNDIEALAASRRAKAEAAHIREAGERDRLAALARAKEEAVRHHAAQGNKEEAGRPGKKKG